MLLDFESFMDEDHPLAQAHAREVVEMVEQGFRVQLNSIRISPDLLFGEPPMKAVPETPWGDREKKNFDDLVILLTKDSEKA